MVYGIYPKRRPTYLELEAWSATYYRNCTHTTSAEDIFKVMVNLIPNGMEFTMGDAQRMVDIQLDYEYNHMRWEEDEPTQPETDEWLKNKLKGGWDEQ